MKKLLLNYSRKNKICMNFVVGRISSEKYIKYSSNLYNKYKDV